MNFDLPDPFGPTTMLIAPSLRFSIEAMLLDLRGESPMYATSGSKT